MRDMTKFLLINIHGIFIGGTPNANAGTDRRFALSINSFGFGVCPHRPGKQNRENFQGCADIETGGIYAPTQALPLGLIDDIKTIDDVRDQFGKDLTEIGPEATGTPFSHVGRNRGEEIFNLAIQKTRDAIQASK